MIKHLSILIFLIGSLSVKAQSAYSITEFTGGQEVSLSKYRGKKLLIIAMDASVFDIDKLKRYNAFYKSMRDKAAFLLVITGKDAKENQKMMMVMKDSVNLDFEVIHVKSVKKGGGQSRLFQFMTHKEQNGAFDIDVEVPWQMFALSESGKLYAVLLDKEELESGWLRKILLAKTN